MFQAHRVAVTDQGQSADLFKIAPFPPQSANMAQITLDLPDELPRHFLSGDRQNI